MNHFAIKTQTRNILMVRKSRFIMLGREIEKDTGSGRTPAANSDKLQGSIFIP